MQDVSVGRIQAPGKGTLCWDRDAEKMLKWDCTASALSGTEPSRPLNHRRLCSDRHVFMVIRVFVILLWFLSYLFGNSNFRNYQKIRPLQ